MICDLPMDLAEEVLSKLPVTSLRVVRSTCKKLNTLSKSRGFTRKLIAKAAKKKEFQVVMLLENRVSLMSVNLISPSIDPIGKLDRVEISEIYHCEGLLLCINKGDNLNSSRLMVWNPFLGQTRWIQPRNSYHIWDKYALGYDKSLRTHKILRFVDSREPRSERKISEFEIYNLNSNSWKVLDITPDWQWHMKFDQRGLSLKGNTYWYAQEKVKPDEVGFDVPDFLVCFDFTRESFGPHLPLPFHGFVDIVSLSNVGEKQLAVLFQKYCSPAYTLKIWISDNVEPNAVSWKELLLAIDMRPNVGFRFADRAASFFVDEEKNLAVVLDKDRKYFNHRGGRNMAYIIGKNGCFKRVDIGVSKDQYCHRRVCSFVPSSVQI